MIFFASKFKELRLKKKLSMDKVAQELGVNRKTISAWENSNRVPREMKIRALARALKVSVEAISDLAPDPTVSSIPQDEILKMTDTLSSFISPDQKTKRLISNIKSHVNILEEYLGQSNIIINALLRSFNSILYVKNLEQKYIIVNDLFLKNLSITEKKYDYKGKKDADFFTFREAVLNTKEDQNVLSTGQSVLKREGIIPGSRRKKIGYVSKIPVFDVEDNIIGVMGIFNDMTDKIRLNEIRKCLENGLGNFSDVVWLVENRPTKKVIYVSESVEKIYGFKAQEFYKRAELKLECCIYQEDKKKFLSNFLENTEVLKFEYRIITKSGKQKWIETRASIKKYIGKDCILLVERDITERKAAEKNRELLEIYVNTMKEGLEIYDEEENVFAYCNKGVADIFGYPVECFYEGGADFWVNTCVHPDFREEQYRHIKEKSWPSKSEYKIMRPNGEIRWVEVTFSFNEYRGKECCVCLFRDITDEEFERHEQQKKNHALRWAAHRLAEYLGSIVKDAEADETEVFDLPPITKRSAEVSKLPTVVYVMQPQSQMEESGYNDLIYGWDTNNMLPTLMHPNEILDGSIISGSFMPCSSKWSTYDFQNCPTIKKLYEIHGKKINFLGVVMSNLNVSLEQKERAAMFVQQISQTLGADAAILAEEGYGNPDADFIACFVALEEAGIKTIGMTNECTGRDGKSQPLVSLDEKANAIVSCGNVSELIKLPPMNTVIGELEALARDGLSGGWAGDEKLGPSVKEDGSIIMENNSMFCGDRVLGWSTKTMKEF